MNQNHANMVNIEKLAKYQGKMAGGGSREQRKIYQIKINEYSQKLAANGYDVNRLMKGGGVITDALKNAGNDLNDEIRKLGTAVSSDALTTQINALQTQVSNAIGNHSKLVGEYGELGVSAMDTIHTAKQHALDLANSQQGLNGVAANITTQTDTLRKGIEDTTKDLLTAALADGAYRDYKVNKTGTSPTMFKNTLPGLTQSDFGQLREYLKKEHSGEEADIDSFMALINPQSAPQQTTSAAATDTQAAS